MPINSGNRFAEKAKACGDMLKEINCVTKSLQTRCRPLNECKQDIKELFSAIEASVDDDSLPLHNCTLGTYYLATDSSFATDPLFESAVVKLQNGVSGTLTEDEKVAVRSLRVKNAGSSGEGAGTSNRFMSMKERLEKRRKLSMTPESTYIPCNFVLGSVAEVERVWSIAKHLLHGEIRNCLTPLLLEALIFLRFNSRFWDAKLVAHAIVHAKTERGKKRIAPVEVEVRDLGEESGSEMDLDF